MTDIFDSIRIKSPTVKTVLDPADRDWGGKWLTDNQLKEVRALLARGLPTANIAERFDVPERIIQAVKEDRYGYDGKILEHNPTMLDPDEPGIEPVKSERQEALRETALQQPVHSTGYNEVMKKFLAGNGNHRKRNCAWCEEVYITTNAMQKYCNVKCSKEAQSHNKNIARQRRKR